MKMYKVRDEVRQLDDNLGRHIECLDWQQPPTWTEWCRRRYEDDDPYVHIEFL